MKGSESVSFSGSRFCLVVESLDDATGDLAFGAEPVQQEVAVPSQHAGHTLHRLNLRVQGGAAPAIQKVPSPIGRAVVPEKLEVFLEQIGTDRFQVVPQQVGQPATLGPSRQIAGPRCAPCPTSERTAARSSPSASPRSTASVCSDHRSGRPGSDSDAPSARRSRRCRWTESPTDPGVLGPKTPPFPPR